MEEEIVCLDLQTLFECLYTGMCKDNEVYTRYSHYIRREPSPDGNNYYDLYKDGYSSLKLCCDGEQCKVLERTADYVKLIDVENIDNEELEGIDTSFKLSVTAFEIATGGRI